MNVLLIINRRSGHCVNIEERLKKLLEERNFNNIETVELIDDSTPDLYTLSKNKEAVICCGGDGTLNSVLNSISPSVPELIYFPCGTFNDMAGQYKEIKAPEHLAVGAVNDRLFGYVAATGTFTPIGYNTNLKLKRRLHKFAYFLTTLKEYKIWKIPAKINFDNEIIEDTFTLIMFVKSKRVFGFNFNRLYNPESNNAQLLLIKAPRGIFPHIKLFFMFFRVFILGLSKEYRTKNIIFHTVQAASVSLERPIPFCLDGERYDNGREFNVQTNKKKIKITIYNK